MVVRGGGGGGAGAAAAAAAAAAPAAGQPAAAAAADDDRGMDDVAPALPVGGGGPAPAPPFAAPAEEVCLEFELSNAMQALVLKAKDLIASTGFRAIKRNLPSGTVVWTGKPVMNRCLTMRRALKADNGADFVAALVPKRVVERTPPPQAAVPSPPSPTPPPPAVAAAASAAVLGAVAAPAPAAARAPAAKKPKRAYQRAQVCRGLLVETERGWVVGERAWLWKGLPEPSSDT